MSTTLNYGDIADMLTGCLTAVREYWTEHDAPHADKGVNSFAPKDTDEVSRVINVVIDKLRQSPSSDPADAASEGEEWRKLAGLVNLHMWKHPDTPRHSPNGFIGSFDLMCAASAEAACYYADREAEIRRGQFSDPNDRDFFANECLRYTLEALCLMDLKYSRNSLKWMLNKFNPFREECGSMALKATYCKAETVVSHC
jgi:hypothetical protein